MNEQFKQKLPFLGFAVVCLIILISIAVSQPDSIQLILVAVVSIAAQVVVHSTDVFSGKRSDSFHAQQCIRRPFDYLFIIGLPVCLFILANNRLRHTKELFSVNLITSIMLVVSSISFCLPHNGKMGFRFAWLKRSVSAWKATHRVFGILGWIIAILISITAGHWDPLFVCGVGVIAWVLGGVLTSLLSILIERMLPSR